MYCDTYTFLETESIMSAMTSMHLFCSRVICYNDAVVALPGFKLLAFHCAIRLFL